VVSRSGVSAGVQRSSWCIRSGEGGVDDDGAHAAPAAARARQHVGGEHPAQQLGPRDPAAAFGAARRRRAGWIGRARGHQRLARHARGNGFDPRHPDKQAHLATSYGLTLTIAVLARHGDVDRWRALAVAAATALVLGTGKELVDGTGYDWGDQLANAIGTSAAIGVVFAFEL
jgi:hypothetical protein